MSFISIIGHRGFLSPVTQFFCQFGRYILSIRTFVNAYTFPTSTVSRFCDYVDYELGEMADLWDVVIGGAFHEGGYGTSGIAAKAARKFIDAKVVGL